MTEIKTFYTIANLNTQEINFALGQIANRLDALEGLRGTPRFYSNINAGGKKIQNVEQATEVNDALTLGSDIDHGSLTGLVDDDHSQYLLLSGRGNQIITDSLTIGTVSSGKYITIANGVITVYSGGEIVHKIEG